MPAPDKGSIKIFLKAALVSGTDPFGPRIAGQRQAFLKSVNMVVIPGVLPDTVDDLADALAEGIANQWLAWQEAQTVAILPPPYGAVVDTTTTAPIAGISGPKSLP